MTSFCTHCGSQLPEGSMFCPNCGKPVAAATAPEMPAQPQMPVQEPAPAFQAQPVPQGMAAAPALAKPSAFQRLFQTIRRRWKLFLPIGCALVVVIVLAIALPFLFASQQGRHMMVYQTDDGEAYIALSGKEDSPYELEGSDVLYHPVTWNADRSKMLYLDGEDNTLYCQETSENALKNEERIKIDSEVSSNVVDFRAFLVQEQKAMEDGDISGLQDVGNGGVFSEDGNSVYYLTTSGDVYRFDLKSEKKEKLFSGVNAGNGVSISAEENAALFEDEDGTLVYADLKTGDTKQITSEYDTLYTPYFVDGQYVYYNKGGDLFRYSATEDKSEKLASEILAAFSIQDNGTFYFTKEEPLSIPLVDYIEDDMKEADEQAAQESGEPTVTWSQLEWESFYLEGDSDSFWRDDIYFSDLTSDGFEVSYNFSDAVATLTDEENTATVITYSYGPDDFFPPESVEEAEESGGGAYQQTLTLSLEDGMPVLTVSEAETLVEPEEGAGSENTIPAGRYLAEDWEPDLTEYEARNEFRNLIQDQTADSTRTNLFYYNGKEAVKLCDAYLGTVEQPSALLSENNILVYHKSETGAPARIKMSEVDAFELLDLAQYYSGADLADALSGLSTTSEDGDLESTSTTGTPCVAINGTESALSAEQFGNVQVDGNTLYYLETIEQEDGSESAGRLMKAKISKDALGEAEEVHSDVVSYRLQDGKVWYFQEGSADTSEVGDLYYNDEVVAYDVYASSLVFKDGTAFFLADYDGINGTLTRFQNGEAESIADDVYQFRARDGKYAAFVQDTGDGDYDLLLFTGKEELTEVDRGVNFISQLV